MPGVTRAVVTAPQGPDLGHVSTCRARVVVTVGESLLVKFAAALTARTSLRRLVLGIEEDGWGGGEADRAVPAAAVQVVVAPATTVHVEHDSRVHSGRFRE